MTPSCVSRFFHFAGTTTTLPLDCHPIVFQQVGEALWTHRPFLPGPTSQSHLMPPLCHPTRETITLGSDGSVHLAQQVAACAWMIYDDADHFAMACFLLSKISSLSSYRSELEGIFRSLKHVKYLGMSPTKISHWCDNEAAVNKCMAPPWKPSLMIQPDADILLAIHQIWRTLLANGTTVICRHI